uniref:Oxysterol binding protein 2 n=1 Tax=Equus caballus TaxID=9796 RepID=A0A9L0RIG2_HORSE
MSGAARTSTAPTVELPLDSLKGWLLKWTNYLKGYQRRWFVLSNGLLSYYRNQDEMAHTCRGTINLCTAHFDKEDSCGIMLTNGARTYHLKASSEVERQHWITTLELAKAKAVHLMSSHSVWFLDFSRPFRCCRGSAPGAAVRRGSPGACTCAWGQTFSQAL